MTYQSQYGRCRPTVWDRFHKHHLGWTLVVVAVLMVLAIAIAVYYHGRRDYWAGRTSQEYEQFVRHVECMKNPHCDSMLVGPIKQDPNQ